MLRWIIASSLRMRRIVVVAAAGVLVVAIVQVGRTPVDSLPEFNPPMVEVQTEALGLSAAEVEQLITVPLEQDLLVGVPFLDEIESVSLPGLSSVVMTFEPGTDLLDARQVVQERLTQAVGVAGLPAVAKTPQMIQPLSSKSRVSMVKLSSEQLTPIEMSVLSRWVIGPRLMGVPGVANVAIWGNRERQLQVLVDPERLAENSATLAQVIRTAGNALEVSPLSFLEASTPGTGGFIDTVNQRLNIFHEQAITSAEELAQVPLETPDGGPASGDPPATLGQVADVVEDHQPLIGDAVCGGGQQCLLLVVEKFPGANSLAVTKGVEDALDAMRPGLGDMQLDSSVYRPASFVENSFLSLGWALLVGAVLLLLVVGLVFADWRRVLVTAAAVAVSLATAVAVLLLRGVTVNLMVAAGLLLGLTAVVHDAVGDVSALARRMRKFREENSAPAWRAIVDTSAEMRRSVIYAVLIVAATTVPVLFLQGEGRAFLPPIVLSFLLAVAASMLVALVLTPALALLLLTKVPLHRSESVVVRRLHAGYDRVAPRLVGRTGLAVAAVGGIAVIGLATVPFLDVSLRPTLKERDVLVHVEAAPGTSLPRMTQITTEVVEDLDALPGVTQAGGQLGRAVMSDQTVDVNSGELWVSVDPDADYGAMLDAIAATVQRYPDLSSDVMTYSEERVTEVLGRSEADVVVRVYGENAEVLGAKADEIQQLVGDVEGVSSVDVQRTPVEQTVEVEVRLDQAQAFGIKPGDVRRAAASLLGGITVGNLFEEQKVFDVVVWATPQLRQSVDAVQGLLIDTPGGDQVRLGEVADVRLAPNPTHIRHESVARYLDVSAAVAGRPLDEVARDIDALVKQVEFPLEHHAEVLGGFEDRQAARSGLVAAGLAATIAVFLLLQAAFLSWRVAVLAFLTLPLALVGGIAAALLTGGTLGLGSLGGLVAVLGIAARDLVLLLQRYQRLERGGMRFGPELVLRGTRDAVAPTITSAVATALLLLPLVVVGNVSGFEIVHPAVVVVLGGLVTATVTTLFVVPILYLRFGYVAAPDTWSHDLLVRIPEQRVSPPQQTTTGVLQRVRPAFLVVPALFVASCAGTVADAYVVESEPAHLETVAGSHTPHVVLTGQAVERLGIQTSRVEAVDDGLMVPSAAIFVDTEGVWWVYTASGEGSYVRHRVDLVRDDGGQALLSSGPPPGTEVVTVGVAELAGVEADVGN